MTDTLESPNQVPDFTAGLLQARLTEERKRALEVKKDLYECLRLPRVILPMIANSGTRKMKARDPPRAREVGCGTATSGEGAEPPILEDFLAPVREAGGKAYISRTMYNDYVYFWRWALWKVLDSTEDAGIVTFITASSYLCAVRVLQACVRRCGKFLMNYGSSTLKGIVWGLERQTMFSPSRFPVAIAIGMSGRP